MRWNSAHVGNIRQVPIGDQEVVNPEMKVPDEQNPLVEDEEAEPKSLRAADDAPSAKDGPKSGPVTDGPKAHDAPKDAPSGAKH